jgi:hypothetical protein
MALFKRASRTQPVAEMTQIAESVAQQVTFERQSSYDQSKGIRESPLVPTMAGMLTMVWRDRRGDFDGVIRCSEDAMYICYQRGSLMPRIEARSIRGMAWDASRTALQVRAPSGAFLGLALARPIPWDESVERNLGMWWELAMQRQTQGEALT